MAEDQTAEELDPTSGDEEENGGGSEAHLVALHHLPPALPVKVALPMDGHICRYGNASNGLLCT